MTNFSVDKAKKMAIEFPGEMVTRETHFVQEVQNLHKSLILSSGGPFYLDNFKLEHRSDDGALTELSPEDFRFILRFNAASVLLGKDIYGGIEVFSKFPNGFFYITYKKLGKMFEVEQGKALERVLKLTYEPCFSLWENVFDIPHSFVVKAHELHTKDMKGFDDLIKVMREGLEKLSGNKEGNLFFHKELLEEKTERVKLEKRVRSLEAKLEELHEQLNK